MKPGLPYPLSNAVAPAAEQRSEMSHRHTGLWNAKSRGYSRPGSSNGTVHRRNVPSRFRPRIPERRSPPRCQSASTEPGSGVADGTDYRDCPIQNHRLIIEVIGNPPTAVAENAMPSPDRAHGLVLGDHRALDALHNDRYGSPFVGELLPRNCAPRHLIYGRLHDGSAVEEAHVVAGKRREPCHNDPSDRACSRTLGESSTGPNKAPIRRRHGGRTGG